MIARLLTAVLFTQVFWTAVAAQELTPQQRQAVEGIGTFVELWVFARDVTLGIAPYHGRVMIVDEACAESQTGHGSPLPHLVHGGPGRAGGGEELGGVRAVHHHLHRIAVQGSPDVLTAVSDSYVRGAARTTDGPVMIGMAVKCPRCHSLNTREITRFGSTSCKALYTCRECLEPFDYFKCI